MEVLAGQEISDALVDSDALDFLEDQCKYIDSGSFNKVFHHPDFSDRVIKYNWAMEDGTMQFAKYCNDHRSINLPTVYEMHNTMWHSVLVQEKLNAVTNAKHVKMLLAMRKLTVGQWNNYFTKKYESFIVFISHLQMETGAKYNEEEVSFIRTCYETVVHFAPNYTIDIAVANVMVRGSTLVLVDPLASEY